jgi:signal transduction histidine kinase
MQIFRFKKLILVLGAAVLVLSLALFLVGIKTGDNPPGMLFFTAFALLAALSLGLLAVLYQSLTVSVVKTLTGDRPREKADVPAARVRETGAGPGNPEGASASEDPGAKILSETAGELRTSVEVIQEELEEILDDDIPADKEHIESLYSETDRIKKIIIGMEQLSQAQALSRSLKRIFVQLEPMLNDLIEKNRAALNDKDVAFTLECEPGLTMTADPDCLAWIMRNLIDNAAKAVKDAGSVSVAARRSVDQFVFSVKDTGAGIRRSHIPHLFERFFRGAGSGIGMGLAIVKVLVDACGGRIEVETATGKGSSFTVQLPSA